MVKQTNYSKLKNLLLVVSFNQPSGENGQKVQPIVIEARCNALTDEGAVRNVSTKLNVGVEQTIKLTNKEIYTKVKAFNSQLGALLKDLVLDALDEDVVE